MNKYVELFCDEKDGFWKLTVWTVPGRDFDPMTCVYENTPYFSSSMEAARKEQRRIVASLRSQGFTVYSNTSSKDSYFYVMPKSIVSMIIGLTLN